MGPTGSSPAACTKFQKKGRPFWGLFYFVPRCHFCKAADFLKLDDLCLRYLPIANVKLQAVSNFAIPVTNPKR
jgi:hypothetical protein